MDKFLRKAKEDRFAASDMAGDYKNSRKECTVYEQKSKKTVGNGTVFSASDHFGVSDDVPAVCS